MNCALLDVFSRTPFGGNGLAVFETVAPLTSAQMLAYTRELRQFESIFFTRGEHPNQVSARIFTMEEELDFAGHPLLGLAAHLHSERGSRTAVKWEISLNSGVINVTSERRPETPAHNQSTYETPMEPDYFHAMMQQGPPQFIRVLPATTHTEVLEALSLNGDCMAPLPMEVISTGLPYLIVPLRMGLEKARIHSNQFEALLAKHGAQFVYVLDVAQREGRTWDNLGQVEDIATGSAAGPAAAFLWKHQQLNEASRLTLSQGRFMHRPSVIEIQLNTENKAIKDILVGGDVCPVAKLEFV